MTSLSTAVGAPTAARGEDGLKVEKMVLHPISQSEMGEWEEWARENVLLLAANVLGRAKDLDLNDRRIIMQAAYDDVHNISMAHVAGKLDLVTMAGMMKLVIMSLHKGNPHTTLTEIHEAKLDLEHAWKKIAYISGWKVVTGFEAAETVDELLFGVALLMGIDEVDESNVLKKITAKVAELKEAEKKKAQKKQQSVPEKPAPNSTT